MKFDITKIANAILFMIENKVTNLNEKKLSALLFLIDYTHLEKHGEKVFGEKYIKTKRAPEPKILGDLFRIIADDIDLEDEDERVYIITELLDFLDIEILDKQKFVELGFIKMEKVYDPSLFFPNEKEVMSEIIRKYKNETPRQISNTTFGIEKVRETATSEVII
ncbi:Panacea domain-containing protein [Arcobacteraceae bacterium]|nr:Panacea domain-containing protein [Arcobacteraceae bacterium]